MSTIFKITASAGWYSGITIYSQHLKTHAAVRLADYLSYWILLKFLWLGGGPEVMCSLCKHGVFGLEVDRKPNYV